jgi:hypothetical protein
MQIGITFGLAAKMRQFANANSLRGKTKLSMSRFNELVKTANVTSVTGGLKMITRFNTIPKPGQVLLYIDFSSLTTRSIADALILVNNPTLNLDPLGRRF